MKKIASLLLAAAMLFALSACGESMQPIVYNEEAEQAPLSIYFLNAEPEADELWQSLAREYTELSGVPVTVLSPAQGEYEQTFNEEMSKVKAPSIFQCSRASFSSKENFCYDLSGSEFLNEQLLPLNLTDVEGRILAAGFSYSSYGLMLNRALLEKSGHSADELTSMEGLKAVADDVHARAEELGFDAFSPAGLEESSAFRFTAQLANLPLFYQFRDGYISSQPEAVGKEYLENFKALWDLYITDSSVSGSALLKSTLDDSLKSFAEGRSLFYQGSADDFDRLSGMNADLAGIEFRPFIFGVEGEEFSGLCCGTDRYLAVNNECPQEEILASVEFINWLASAEASQKISDYFGASLFKSVAEYKNPFMNRAKNLIDKGSYNIDWVYTMTPNADQWRADFADALGRYSSGSADWAVVEKAFSDGWAEQYSSEHSPA